MWSSLAVDVLVLPEYNFYRLTLNKFLLYVHLFLCFSNIISWKKFNGVTLAENSDRKISDVTAFAAVIVSSEPITRFSRKSHMICQIVRLSNE